MQLSDITVNTFMRCLFKKDYTGVDDWEELYTSYIDMSGLGDTMQYSLMVTIHNLQVRLSAINAFLDLQEKFFIAFDFPFEPAFKDVERFGHRITWDPAYPQQFLDQLQRMENKEKRNVVELDEQMLELKELKETSIYKQKANNRADFIKMLNTLGKEGYRIDREKTDMETLALMIKQHSEDIDALNTNH